MKKIRLTQDKVALIDDEDFETVNRWTWQARKNGLTFYAARTIKIRGKCTTSYMHREILDVVKGMDIDHIDHDTLNNQKSNLRICTRSQNNMNRASKSHGSSKYKGVCYCKRKEPWVMHSPWMSSIRLNKKNHYIGNFLTEEAAALAYNIKAKELFGEFANLNIVR